MMIVLVNKNKEVVNFKTGEVFRVLDKTIDVSKENLFDKYYYNELIKAMNTEKEVFMKNIDTSMEIDYDKYDIYTFTTSVQYCITNDIKGIQSGEFRGFKVLTRTMNAAHGNHMKYEIGKLYEEDIIPRVGTCGFHFSDNFVDASMQYVLERNIRMFTVKIPKGSILSVCSFDAIGGMVYSSNKIILESEVNVEDYLMNIDIKSEMSNNIFRNCSLNNFNLSIDFYKYIVNSDLPDDYLKSVLITKFDRVNEADEWNSEWEDILDETIERFDRNGDSVFINDLLTYYSSEKRIKILKEKNIYDLSCIEVGDFPILGLQYFLDNADKFRLQRLSMYASLKLVNVLYKMIDSSDIIFNNIDNEIIKHYLLNINLDMFRELINNHFTWVMNNLDKFNLFKLASMSEKDYNELLLKIDDPSLHYERLDAYGVCSFELFVKLVEKSKIKFKEYKYISFTTLEQIEYIIKKCGNRYDMILDILYINRYRFGINSIYGQDSLKYEYLIKKYSKLNKRQNKRKHFNFRRIVGHIPEDFDGDFKINDMSIDDERLVKVPRICSQERHSVFGTEWFRRIF